MMPKFCGFMLRALVGLASRPLLSRPSVEESQGQQLLLGCRGFPDGAAAPRCRNPAVEGVARRRRRGVPEGVHRWWRWSLVAKGVACRSNPGWRARRNAGRRVDVAHVGGVALLRADKARPLLLLVLVLGRGPSDHRRRRHRSGDKRLRHFVHSSKSRRGSLPQPGRDLIAEAAESQQQGGRQHRRGRGRRRSCLSPSHTHGPDERQPRAPDLGADIGGAAKRGSHLDRHGRRAAARSPWRGESRGRRASSPRIWAATEDHVRGDVRRWHPRDVRQHRLLRRLVEAVACGVRGSVLKGEHVQHDDTGRKRWIGRRKGRS
mmetsp:Transcript_8583/g.26937  ORF Transcript_8583/g.26937 Transcript_8583/m.26937 type:complete len:319 (-) Transcript_8583:50-1006(-)